MSTLEMFDGSLDPSVFLDTFAYIFLCRSFIYPAESRMWSVSEFASQVEIVWNVVIWTISSQFYIERCFDFCKREFVQLPFQKWSFSWGKNKANQIWLAVSCIVSVLCVWGGVGCAPGKHHGKTQRFRWGTFLCGAPVMLKLWKNWLMVDGAGFMFGVVPQFERCFFFPWVKEEEVARGFVGKPTCSVFFVVLLFWNFLVNIFLCMAYIMSILCGLIMFD